MVHRESIICSNGRRVSGCPPSRSPITATCTESPSSRERPKKHGVQGILGCEFYLSPDMADRNDKRRYHQVLLAKNETGYRNLIKLGSLAYTDGFYYKPRIDRETLAAHAEGLIATTCCLQGEVPQAILHKGEDAARSIFEAYLDIFGDDYYIELQDHGLADQKKLNEVLVRWASEYNVKTIATKRRPLRRAVGCRNHTTSCSVFRPVPISTIRAGCASTTISSI